jgi:hypothetical protein
MSINMKENVLTHLFNSPHCGSDKNNYNAKE